jgi:acetyl-CoA C-acetyltransferase
MTRHSVAAFSHRQGFRLGASVGFKDYLWESLNDPAPGISMIQTPRTWRRSTASHVQMSTRSLRGYSNVPFERKGEAG